MTRSRHSPFFFSCLLSCLFLLVITLTACGRSVVPSPRSSAVVGPASSYKPGELLIKFRTGVPPERRTEITRQLGVEPITYDQRFSLLHAKITNGRSVEEMVKRCAEVPDVEYAEPNYIRKSLEQTP